MPKITLAADPQFLRALQAEPDLPITDIELTPGSQGESERLGFELGNIEHLIGYIAAGIEAIVIARHLINAAKASRKAKLELTSPTGRIAVDLDGKTPEEVADLMKAAIPFTK